MNSTKNNLVKASAIFAIISGVLSLVSFIFELCDFGYIGETVTGSGYLDGQIIQTVSIIILVLEFVTGLCSLAGGVLLLKSRMQNANNSQKCYKVGCALTIIGGMGLGLQSILLYIAFATANQRFEPEFHEEKLNDNSYAYTERPLSHENENIERQIKILRDMKAHGEITDEEFKKYMFDIIRNQK